jgi:hypothetical protein
MVGTACTPGLDYRSLAAAASFTCRNLRFWRSASKRVGVGFLKHRFWNRTWLFTWIEQRLLPLVSYRPGCLAGTLIERSAINLMKSQGVANGQTGSAAWQSSPGNGAWTTKFKRLKTCTTSQAAAHQTIIPKESASLLPLGKDARHPAS